MANSRRWLMVVFDDWSGRRWGPGSCSSLVTIALVMITVRYLFKIDQQLERFTDNIVNTCNEINMKDAYCFLLLGMIVLQYSVYCLNHACKRYYNS